MRLPFAQNPPDDFQTPPYALDPILPLIHKEWTIWECAAGKGMMVEALRAKGFKTIGTDIAEGYDFLSWEPPEWDCVVTNPPYSLKDQFVRRCYRLGKPFAMLMPLTALESAERQRLYRDQGLELVVLDKRVNFVRADDGKRSWFASAWFTNGLDIGRQLTFAELRRTKPCGRNEKLWP